MENTERRRSFSSTLKVCLLQTVIGLVWALVTLSVAGQSAATAALWGVVCAVLPSLYMAVNVFLRSAGKTPAEILGAFYRAAAGKFVLAGVCFYLGARGFPAHFLSLMLAYCACITAYWLALALIRLD